ncbi:MAG: hypothetical protein ABI550_09825 [Ignavibacteriaceae bacterium]
MDKKELRFAKLNKYLGYGNPDSNIIFIAIEERDSWELKNLIKGMITVLQSHRD